MQLLCYSLESKVRLGKTLHPISLLIIALGRGQGHQQNTETVARKPEFLRHLDSGIDQTPPKEYKSSQIDINLGKKCPVISGQMMSSWRAELGVTSELTRILTSLSENSLGYFCLVGQWWQDDVHFFPTFPNRWVFLVITCSFSGIDISQFDHLAMGCWII